MRKVCFFAIICILLTCIGGCAIVSCGDDYTKQKENPGYSTVVPVYFDDAQLELMVFWMPPIDEQHYIWMKEYGVTAVLVDGKYDSTSDGNRQKILQMCNELDMDVYFIMDRERDGREIQSYYN